MTPQWQKIDNTCFICVFQIFEWWYFKKYGTSFIEQVSLNHISPLLGGGDPPPVESNAHPTTPPHRTSSSNNSTTQNHTVPGRVSTTQNHTVPGRASTTHNHTIPGRVSTTQYQVAHQPHSTSIVLFLLLFPLYGMKHAGIYHQY